MENVISFKSKFGWITAVENKNKILSVDFDKSKNKGNLTYLKNKLQYHVPLIVER